MAKRSKWLVYVGKEVPLQTKDAHKPFKRKAIIQALRDLNFQHIEGRLWVRDDCEEWSAKDVRKKIWKKAGIRDVYDRGQQRLIVTKFVVGDGATSVQSQYKKWLG